MHPDFPDSISTLGGEAPEGADDVGAAGGGCSLRNFDSRGVNALPMPQIAADVVP